MGVPITDDHIELARVARTFLTNRAALHAARDALDGDESLPPLWRDVAELGWLGLHLPPEHGGSGYGLLELAVVVEEMGRFCTPGPFLPTVVVAAAVSASEGSAAHQELLQSLADGSTVAGFGKGGSVTIAGTTLHGEAPAVLGASAADVLAIVVGDDLVLVDAGAPGVKVEVRPNVDPTQPVAVVHLTDVELAAGRMIEGAGSVALRVLDLLAAAQAAGGIAACQETATAYAKDRVAFGRPIGQFQAVKHHCANMLADEQLAVSAVWDAARIGEAQALTSVAARTAAAVSLAAFTRVAKTTIQVLGGIGYTWEHDAHLYLRRSLALEALCGPLDEVRRNVADLSESGDERRALELPPEAEEHATAAREFVARYWELPEIERHQFVVESGYLYPHWPAPWGRGAGPLEQIVVDEVLSEVPRYAPLGDPAWTLPIVLPTIMAHGTPDQQERWIRPTMDAHLKWCQLFSEPGAGSDLASLATRAQRADGGWLVTGQKVWTSSAHQAQRGFALVRTDPDVAKHQGITAMVVDMSAPGVTVRPLRQITGEEHFNEVFLDEVFVPDEDVVGDVNAGWSVALTTLSHERVSLGEAEATQGEPWATIRALAVSEGARAEVGDIVATGTAARAMNLRIAARAVSGQSAGVEGNVTKLIGTTHSQRIASFGMSVLGIDAAYSDGIAEPVLHHFLTSRAATIAGGTSEILRNVIGERVLGLPRDPKPTEPKKGRS